jgi:amino acid permease
VCVAVAAALPYVADLISLVGALLTCSISFILPALMHQSLCGADLPAWQKALDGGVLALGVACAAVGARAALRSLAAKMAAAAA